MLASDDTIIHHWPDTARRRGLGDALKRGFDFGLWRQHIRRQRRMVMNITVYLGAHEGNDTHIQESR